MKNLLLATLLMLLLCAATSAQPHHAFAKQSQTARSKSDQKHANSITGRLVTDSGQPIPNSVIYIIQAGRPRPKSRSTNTDDEGRFRVNDLARGVYWILPNAPGYIFTDKRDRRKIYRAGETVNITFTKGGVITGTVTNSAGEPMVALMVQAIPVKDKDGRAIPNTMAANNNAITDDRGVYRLYGLDTGSYLVIANGHDANYGLSVYKDEIPTYYPSSTFDTAIPVTLRAGEEITGIDIRYRSEQGHTISGNIAVGSAINSSEISIILNLTHVSSNLLEATTYFYPGRNSRSFEFSGVPDDDYYITAQMYDYGGKETGGAGRARVKVKGADVTGLEINVLPLGSISGTVIIEAARKPVNCEINQRLSPDETIIRASREEKDDKKADRLPVFWSSLQSTPTDKGEFTMNYVEAGRYHIGGNFIGEELYVRSVTLPSPVPAKPAIDAARNGFWIKQGERRAGLNITLTEGAAGIKGRILPATEGAQLPDRLRIHLVPAEKEAVNDVLRFAEATAQSDGSFSISSIAPGRYWIVALPIEDDDSSANPQPLAWEGDGRKQLRREGEAAAIAIELQPCQRVTDYVLRYKKR